MNLKEFQLHMLLLNWEVERSRPEKKWKKGDRRIVYDPLAVPNIKLYLEVGNGVNPRKPIRFQCFDSLCSYMHNWRDT